MPASASRLAGQPIACPVLQQPVLAVRAPPDVKQFFKNPPRLVQAVRALPDVSSVRVCADSPRPSVPNGSLPPCGAWRGLLLLASPSLANSDTQSL